MHETGKNKTGIPKVTTETPANRKGHKKGQAISKRFQEEQLLG